jgi:hypothetical protein
MDTDMASELKAGGDHCEAARLLADRHGDHAADYVLARIEASETAGEDADASEWRKVLDALNGSPKAD